MIFDMDLKLPRQSQSGQEIPWPRNSIRHYREEVRGLDVVELERLMKPMGKGFNRTDIARYEDGARELTFRKAEQFAAALKVPVGYLGYPGHSWGVKRVPIVAGMDLICRVAEYPEPHRQIGVVGIRATSIVPPTTGAIEVLSSAVALIPGTVILYDTKSRHPISSQILQQQADNRRFVTHLADDNTTWCLWTIRRGTIKGLYNLSLEGRAPMKNREIAWVSEVIDTAQLTKPPHLSAEDLQQIGLPWP